MTEAAHGGRVRRVVIRSVIVLVVGAAVLIPILYYASTVDVSPPRVAHFLLTQHLPGDDGVALTTTSLEIVFSEAVDHAAAQSSFEIAPAVRGSFSWSGLTMVFTPANRLGLETDFAVMLKAGVTDRAGNRMGAAGPYPFRTVGGPSVVATRPADGVQGVPLDAGIQLTFSTLMDTLSVERALQITPALEVSLRWNGTDLAIQPVDRLEPGQAYTVVLGSEARDIAGTTLTDPVRFAFTTVTAGLTAQTITPADRTLGIAVTSSIAVIFDRAIDPTTVNDRVLSITPAVAGGVALGPAEGAAGLGDSGRRVVRFTPSGTLPANTTFTVTLAESVRGSDGSLLPGPLTWSFTTGAPSASLGNQVVFLSARSGIANLWAMNPDGSNQHEVSAELSPVISYAISPDGRSFVVGDGLRLVAQRADGSNRRVMTDDGAVEFDPTFSPDGSILAFGRADRATGSGLGLWRRPTEGGTPERIQIQQPAPTGSPGPSPLPSPGASGGATPSPLLRAPRYSPDGTRLAFVDLSGSVGIVNLADGTLTAAPFDAAAPPVWMPSGSSALFSGLTAGDQGGLTGSGSLLPGTAVQPLTPAGLGLSRIQRGELRLAELQVGIDVALPEPVPAPAALPAVDPNGRIAFVALDPRLSNAGRVWVTGAVTGVPAPLVLPGAGFESGVTFAPQPDRLVVSRVPGPDQAPPTPQPTSTPQPSASPGSTAQATSTPPPGTEASTGGIWLVILETRETVQLSSDGWLARWLP